MFNIWNNRVSHLVELMLDSKFRASRRTIKLTGRGGLSESVLLHIYVDLYIFCLCMYIFPLCNLNWFFYYFVEASGCHGVTLLFMFCWDSWSDDIVLSGKQCVFSTVKARGMFWPKWPGIPPPPAAAKAHAYSCCWLATNTQTKTQTQTQTRHMPTLAVGLQQAERKKLPQYSSCTSYLCVCSTRSSYHNSRVVQFFFFSPCKVTTWSMCQRNWIFGQLQENGENRIVPKVEQSLCHPGWGGNVSDIVTPHTSGFQMSHPAYFCILCPHTHTACL